MITDEQGLEAFINSELILSALPQMSTRVIDDKELFDTLWGFVKRREPKLSWRSAWILDHATEKHTELLDPILKEIYAELVSTGDSFDGTVRHLIKFVLRRPVLEEEGGWLIDKCMAWLMQNDVPTAIRANSLDYLYQIFLLMPEFENELVSVIDANIEKGCSPGLMNKLKKTRKLLMAKSNK